MSDKAFRQMAAIYVQKSGSEDRRELETILSNDVTQLTPTLDRRVHGKINALKRRKYAGIGGLVAAGLLMVLLVPSLLFPNQQSEAPEPETPVYEMLSLTFELPEQFSIDGVEQDVEKTIYFLENSELDDVVMTLEKSDDLSPFSDLAKISINGQPAYGSSSGDFCLLAFEKEDIIYVLTCRHDINTLVDLSMSIL